MKKGFLAILCIAFLIGGSAALGDEIQQHIFGDLIGRRVTVGMRYAWDAN